MGTVNYGPYYRSDVRALQAQRKAVSGKEAFAPSEMAGIVQGELAARYSDMRSRQNDQRNYELALSRQSLAENQFSTERGIALKKMRQEERAAERAGAATAMQFAGVWGGEGESRLGPGGTAATGYTKDTSSPTDTTPQGRATGAKGTPQPEQAKAGRGATEQALDYASRGLGLINLITGDPLTAKLAAGIKIASPVITPVINYVGEQIMGLFASPIGPSYAADFSGYNYDWGPYGPSSYEADFTGYNYGTSAQDPMSATVGPTGSFLGMNINTGQLGLTPEAYGYQSGTFSDVGGGGGGGGGNTVICTELYRQGILSDEVYLADCAFGNMLPRKVLIGYHSWAIPLTKLMKKSKLITNLVSWFAIPWAKEMAYCMKIRSRGNMVGKIMNFLGIPLCGMIGTILGVPQYRTEEVN